MLDISNLFTQIIAPFANGSSPKLPESPFTTSKEKLNFADYRTLNNNDDKYLNEEQQKKMQKLVEKAKSETGADKEKTAKTLYEKLSDLKDDDGKNYAINSKEFLQNFNALVSQVKDDPALVNELRKTLVTDFGKRTDEERKLGADARKEWYEISYENSLDKLKAKNTTISAELENLSKLDPKKAKDKEEINKFITTINKDFGDIAKFNELLNDAGIKYKVDGSEKEGYSIKSSDANNKTSAVDPKSTKAIQKGTLNTWEKNAESIKDLDTSAFKTADGKKEAQEKIKELANLSDESNKTYTKQDLKERLDLLTKAYKHNLDTGEFSKAELDRARFNLIGKVHEEEKPAIEEYRKQHAGKKEKPPYKSEFSDEISKLNTIAFLRNKGLRENEIVPRLAGAARANGHTSNTGNQTVDNLNDIKSATGGENSALSELIDKSRNWKPKEPEAPDKISDIKLNQLNSATYEANNTISFSDKNGKTGEIKIKLAEFIEGLLANKINLTDSKGNIIKIEDAKNKVTLTKDETKEEVKVEIDNGRGEKIAFGIPLDQLTDEFVKKYTPYATLDELLKNYKDKK
jgi:hypothetical protein